MGYGIMPYRVNLDRLATRFGTSNKPKRREIVKECSRRANSIDSDAAHYQNAPKFMEIVEELLDGKATHEKFGWMYWYAIEGFCEVLGRPMMNDQWARIPTTEMDFFYENFSLWDIPNAPMTIPTPNDFPTVFVLHPERISDEFIQTTLKEAVPEYFQYGQIKSWLEAAKQYKQDLVLFYY